MLKFEEEYEQYYEELKDLSFASIPYFVFGFLKDVDYNHDINYLITRADYCLNFKDCNYSEIESMVYRLNDYKYLNLNDDINVYSLIERDFKVDYDMFKNKYKDLEKKLKIQETKISNFIKEVEFIDKNKTTNNLSFLLSKYNDFSD